MPYKRREPVPEKVMLNTRYKGQFRRKPEGWQMADEIPFWGRTKGRVDEFLRDVNNAD